MKFLSSYIDFILLESTKGKVYYSEEFRTLLEKMGNNDIAIALLTNEGNIEDSYTLIDITDKNDTISFTQVNRISRKYPGMDISKQRFIFNKKSKEEGGEFWREGRTEMKIGRWSRRVAKFILSDIKDSQLEEFVNLYKSTYDGKDVVPFELITGEKIRRYYFENFYTEKKGQLGNSCMRHYKCREYFDIYVENPDVCQLLILKESKGDETIIGRALIWKLTEKEKGGKYHKGDYYMDRVYTINDSDKNLFKEWAREKDMYTFDDGWKPDYIMFVKTKSKKYDQYPYMDTFTMYNPETGYLSNDDGLWPEQGYVKLEETNGSYIGDNVKWSDWHSEYIDIEDAVYCENVEDWLNRDSAVFLDYKDEWAADNHSIVWSEYHEQYFYLDDVTHNEIINDYLYPEKDDIITVKLGPNDLMDLPKERTDLYMEIDGEYFSKTTYIKDPYTGEYHFLSERINGIRYEDILYSKLCKDLLGKDIEGLNDSNVTVEDINETRESLKDLLLNSDESIYPQKPDEKIVKAIEDNIYYKKIVKNYPWATKVGMSKDRPRPEEFIHALEGWMINSQQYNPMYSNRLKMDYHLACIKLLIIGDEARKYERWRGSVPYLWKPMSQMCYTFDYSLFPLEIWKRYLLLSL